MRAVSLFAGIGGFDLALHRAGAEVAAMVEIDKACQVVLRRHFPNARGFADIKSVDGRKLGNIDLVVGGFPCQDVSVAGKRAGLAGERTGLFFEAVRIINETTPQYVILENVPGLLSSNDGRDMGTVLGTLEELGYGLAYRVFDAQYFGVAQRRRRVFIVGSLGDWNGPREILFDGDSGGGSSSESREAPQDLAAISTSGVGGSSAISLVPAIAGPLGSFTGGFRTTDLDGQGAWIAELTGTVTANWSKGPGSTQVESGGILIRDGVRVRRLTPKECERLQGFPDNWTSDEPDTPRYRQLGNAVAVPVVEWIARRLVSWDITHRDMEET